MLHLISSNPLLAGVSLLATGLLGGGWGGKLLSDWLSPARTDRLHEQGWARAGKLEEEIRLLRVALDRGRRRENAWSTAFELLLLAFSLAPDEQPEVIARARGILERALTRGADQ